MLNPRSSDYQSYLLRLWKDGERTGWRASLQSTATGERHIFADIASLLTFLQAYAEDEPPVDSMIDHPVSEQ